MVVAVCVSLILIGTDAYSQRKVYKWTDSDGVIHLSDTLPGGMDSDDAEAITLAPTAAPPLPTVAKPAASKSETRDSDRPPAMQVDRASTVAEANIGDIPLADLDRRCDEAREEKIAPLRKAEIEKCKADRHNDPNWCARFNADYGDGGRTKKGAVRPRMFDDLPECVEALQEKNRRQH
jgi:hypothetical protein